MTSGRQGAFDLAAGVDTLIYTAPPGQTVTATVALFNRNVTTSNALVAFVAGVLINLVDEDYIDGGELRGSGGVLERTGLVMAAGQSIVVKSDVSDVSAQVWCWEEPA